MDLQKGQTSLHVYCPPLNRATKLPGVHSFLILLMLIFWLTPSCMQLQAVLLSESLCRRLPGCQSLWAGVMQHAIVGRVSVEDWGEEEAGSDDLRPRTSLACVSRRPRRGPSCFR